METVKEQAARVLISGASFAGLTTAIWMQRLGYRVTIVENATGLRTGGTAARASGVTVRFVTRGRGGRGWGVGVG